MWLHRVYPVIAAFLARRRVPSVAVPFAIMLSTPVIVIFLFKDFDDANWFSSCGLNVLHFAAACVLAMIPEPELPTIAPGTLVLYLTKESLSVIRAEASLCQDYNCLEQPDQFQISIADIADNLIYLSVTSGLSVLPLIIATARCARGWRREFT